MTDSMIPGPSDNRPRPRPTSPPPPKAAKTDQLAEIDDLLVAALARATLLPETTDPIETCGHAILAFRLRMARKAVADLVAYKTPARQPLDFAAAVVDGPVEPRAGRPPLPGTVTFSLPPVSTVPSFDNGRTEPFELGVGPLYDVLPGRQP